MASNRSAITRPDAVCLSEKRSSIDDVIQYAGPKSRMEICPLPARLIHGWTTFRRSSPFSEASFCDISVTSSRSIDLTKVFHGFSDFIGEV